jgi:carboxypeptidase Taq
MKTYLGIKPKTYKEGILQDIHWSMGAIGYFPTYSLGTFLTGMWLESIEKDLGDLEAVLEKEKGINILQEWFKENIHKFGSTYTSKDLIYKVCHKNFDTQPFINYLKKKYLELYK